MSDPRVVVMNMGALHVNACAAKDATDDEIVREVERECPCGTTGGWHVRETGETTRVTCADEPDRVHVVLSC